MYNGLIYIHVYEYTNEIKLKFTNDSYEPACESLGRYLLTLHAKPYTPEWFRIVTSIGEYLDMEQNQNIHFV